MSSSPRAPLPSLIPETRAVQRRAAHLAQRLVRRAARRSSRASRRSRPSRRRRCCPAASICGAPARRRAAEDDDDAPWHDPAMALAERMKLAEGRPLRRRMMAAMGQQDCGQCGYNCQDYSDAIFFTKGRAAESLRARRQGNRPHAQGAASGAAAAHRRRRPHRRPRPRRLPLLRLRRPPRRAVRAKIRPRRFSRRARASISRAPPRKPGTSSSISTAASIDYAVGDAFGMFPTNDPALADAVIAALGAPADFPIGDRALREVLIDGVSLGAGARHAVPAVLLHHRRRAAAEGEGARRRRGPGRRRRHARRARRHPEIFRRAPRSGGVHRGARSAAAAALLDRLLAQGRPQAASRSPSMPCAIRSTAAPGSASPRPFSPTA